MVLTAGTGGDDDGVIRIHGRIPGDVGADVLLERNGGDALGEGDGALLGAGALDGEFDVVGAAVLRRSEDVVHAAVGIVLTVLIFLVEGELAHRGAREDIVRLAADRTGEQVEGVRSLLDGHGGSRNRAQLGRQEDVDLGEGTLDLLLDGDILVGGELGHDAVEGIAELGVGIAGGRHRERLVVRRGDGVGRVRSLGPESDGILLALDQAELDLALEVAAGLGELIRTGAGGGLAGNQVLFRVINEDQQVLGGRTVRDGLGGYGLTDTDGEGGFNRLASECRIRVDRLLLTGGREKQGRRSKQIEDFFHTVF